MSLGGGFSSSLNLGVAAMRAAGILVAVAAGNENANACSTSPASAPSAITVHLFPAGGCQHARCCRRTWHSVATSLVSAIGALSPSLEVVCVVVCAVVGIGY